MKLSWLNTSMAHTNNNTKHIRMNEQYEWCKIQYKKERVRESGSNANTKIYFEVRSHSSTSPPSHRRISTSSCTQDFPHREPPLRIWGKYNREYTTPLSNKYNLSLEARHKANIISTSQMRDRHKASQTQSPHTWGIPTQSPPLTRGSQKPLPLSP